MNLWLTFTNALAFVVFLALVDLWLLVRWLRRHRKLKAERDQFSKRTRPTLLNLPVEYDSAAQYPTPEESVDHHRKEESAWLSEPIVPVSVPPANVVDEKAEQKLWKGLRSDPKPSRAANKRYGKTPVIPVEKNEAAHAKLQKFSAELRRLKGVHGSAFLSTSCSLLASSPALAAGSEDSYPTAISMYTLGKRIVQELGRDSLEHIMVRGDSGYVLFERVLEDVILIVVIEEDALLGQVVNEARRTADAAADALLA